jgi:hypothetical protein
MKTVPDLIMNPCHFQMRAPKKIPSRRGGWRGDSVRPRRRTRSQTCGASLSKPPPTSGPDGPFPFQEGIWLPLSFPHHIAQLSGESTPKGHALNPEDRLKVVSQETQGQVAPRL